MALDIRRLWNKSPNLSQFDGISGGIMGSMAGASLEAQLKAMGTLGLVFAIVSKNANAVSQVNWHLFRKRDNRGRIAGDEERREDTNALPWQVWEKPNKYMTQQEFIEVFSQHVELTGEGWWWADKPMGFPTSMWPLRPDRMEITPADLPKFIDHYTYRQPSGNKLDIDTDDMVFIRNPDPMDSYRGLGPVKAAGVDIDNMRSSLQWNSRFFKHGMTAGGFIQWSRPLEEPEWKKQMRRFNEGGRGMNNAHRIGIIDDPDAKFVESKFTHKDMEFVNAINLSKEDILEAWGFPKFMLGVVTDVNRANAEASMVVYAQWTLIPRLERIKQALNTEFLPMFGPEVNSLFEFDYESPVPDDEDAEVTRLVQRVQAFAVLRGQGVDAQQALEACGLPDMDITDNQDVEEQEEVNEEVLTNWLNKWTKEHQLAGVNGNGHK